MQNKFIRMNLSKASVSSLITAPVDDSDLLCDGYYYLLEDADAFFAKLKQLATEDRLIVTMNGDVWNVMIYDDYIE